LKNAIDTKFRVKRKKENKKKRSPKLKKNGNKENDFNIIRYFNKFNITYFILFLLDIFLVIYLARKNVVNYVVVRDEEFFVSKTRYLLWGRNYVNVIVIGFFYGYFCLVNKFFLKRENSKKFLALIFISIVIINVLLFVLFTKRVY
jgi:hypothetical protein